MANYLREFELTDSATTEMLVNTKPGVAYGLEMPAFASLTHLRVGNPFPIFEAQLSRDIKPVLPHLTHLAIDLSMVRVPQQTNELEDIVVQLRLLIASPSRARLQRLAIEIPNGLLSTVDTSPVYVASASGHGSDERVAWLKASGDYRRFWLSVGLEQKVKIVQMPKGCRRDQQRLTEWKNSTRGLRGYWERVEEVGQAAAI